MCALGVSELASESDGVSAQPSIPDGKTVGSTGDEALENVMMMLSADRWNCLESESSVRYKVRRDAVTAAVSLSLTAFSDVRIVLQAASDVKTKMNKQRFKK